MPTDGHTPPIRAHPHAQGEVAVVTHLYDFIVWLFGRTADFSRAHRYSLGQRVEENALEILELLIEASYARDKRELLRRANRRLERLRYLIRLSKDLRCLSIPQYAFAAESLQSVGAQIGGWARAIPREPAVPADPPPGMSAPT